MIKISNVFTGEVFEYDIKNQADLVQAWREATEMERCAKELKDQFKKLLPEYLDENGKSDEINGYRFTSMFVQRRTYDKSVMRRVLDEDTYDQFLKPDKTALDKFIKENLEMLGEASTELRESMIEDGRGYSVTKLEKVIRD